MDKSKTLKIILSVSSLFLFGCTTKYERSDIEEYVKGIGLTNFKVSKNRTEMEGEDGYTDYLWEVIDKDSGITFHVLDDYYYGGEALTNFLWDDYDASIFLNYIDGYENNILTIHSSTSEGTSSAWIECTYHNLKELEECYNALIDIQAYYVDLGYSELMTSYYVEYDHSLRYAIEINEEDSGDSHGYLSYFTNEELDHLKENYLLCIIDYRFPEALAEFSEDEIKEFIATNDELVHVSIEHQGVSTTYDDLSASKWFYGISYGTFYEILLREGYPVEGTYDHYTFVGTDGHTYEISYSFNDLDGENSGYYILMDGEKKELFTTINPHLTKTEIKEMTSIILDTVR